MVPEQVNLPQLPVPEPVPMPAHPQGWVPATLLSATGDLVVASPDTNRLTLAGPRHRILAKAGSRSVSFNGVLLHLNAAPLYHDGAWYISEADSDRVLRPLLDGHSATRRFHNASVLIDPGHGGLQGGAVVQGAIEKELALDVSLRLRRILRDDGIIVHMTREDDSTVTLADRPARLAETGSGMLISIHFNQAPREGAQGIETYVLPAPAFPSTSDTGARDVARLEWSAVPGNAFDGESMRLAYEIHRALLQYSGATDRGIKRARLAVLRTATAPAVLVECGFLSNGEERVRVLDGQHRETLAKAIADAVATLIRPATGP